MQVAQSVMDGSIEIHLFPGVPVCRALQLALQPEFYSGDKPAAIAKERRQAIPGACRCCQVRLDQCQILRGQSFVVATLLKHFSIPRSISAVRRRRASHATFLAGSLFGKDALADFAQNAFNFSFSHNSHSGTGSDSDVFALLFCRAWRAVARSRACVQICDSLSQIQTCYSKK